MGDVVAGLIDQVIHHHDGLAGLESRRHHLARPVSALHYVVSERAAEPFYGRRSPTGTMVSAIVGTPESLNFRRTYMRTIVGLPLRGRVYIPDNLSPRAPLRCYSARSFDALRVIKHDFKSRATPALCSSVMRTLFRF